MDKVGSSFDSCVKQIEHKLNCIPLPIHFPIGEGKSFKGFVDLVTLTLNEWKLNQVSAFGKNFTAM